MYTETLLSGSSILIYGRVLSDIKLNHSEYSTIQTPKREGYNKFLENNLKSPDAQLARIYGYAVEGRYYELAKPAIFLVHGNGSDPEPLRPYDSETERRLAQGPGEISKVGTAHQVGNFAVGITVWAYDRADFSLRLDASYGSLEDILLNAETEVEDHHATFSGGKVGGGKVGGGKVGGGKVGGGKVGGGKVGGDY